MAVRYKVSYIAIGVLTAVMLLASNNVYAAADVVMNVGESKWVSLGRGAYEPKSENPDIVTIDGQRTHEGALEVKLTCHKAGGTVITYKSIFEPTSKLLTLTVHCSPMVIPETPIGLISLVGSSLGALYIFKKRLHTINNNI
ncbi:hypothetical protein HRbin04_00801 [archaeon HR04]|nr:hypothetical protein HRbin04_00801 [archaeon HR04]